MKISEFWELGFAVERWRFESETQVRKGGFESEMEI